MVTRTLLSSAWAPEPSGARWATPRALPGTVVPFLWIDPNDPAHLTELEREAREQGARGINLHQAWTPFAIDARPFHELVERVTALALPVFIHLCRAREAGSLVHMARQHRDATFIVAHMLGLGAFADEPGLDNVYFDTSGSKRVRPTDILEAVRRFGDDDVLFGTDTPYAPIPEQLAKFESLQLTGSAKERVLGRTMARLLRLEA